MSAKVAGPDGSALSEGLGPNAQAATRDPHLGGDSYEASMLRNLLARIHRDGGHYLEEHGLDKALEDADAQVVQWLTMQERLADMGEVLALHEVGSAYAHRLAIMLECALLDRAGTWEDGNALLDEYRAACRAAAPSSELPTFLGEPVVRGIRAA